MSRFKPIRASSPPKPSSKRSIDAASDIFDSASSLTPTLSPELASLTRDEIDFIDAVIQRASPSASTFLIVFKVYSELLQERGVDPEQEVVFYNKLLKVGTIKGKNWGEKWDIVKRQQIPEAGPSRVKPSVPPTRAPAASRAKILTRLTGALKAIERDEDAFTLHSHQEDTEATESVAASTEGGLGHTSFSAVTPRAATTTIRRPASPTLTATTNSLGLRANPYSSGYPTRNGTPAYKSTRRPPAMRVPVWDAETSDATVDTAHASSSKPPSYGAATRTFDTSTKTTLYTPLRALAKAQSKATEPPPPVPTTLHPVPPSAKAAVLEARQRSGSVINEADTWKKIEMARYEEDAARFYEERLLERCWKVWHQGYQWIVTTNEQIGEARDNLIVRLALHRWRGQTASRRSEYQRVAATADNRRLRGALHTWRVKLRERQQIKWRYDMRARMKIVRDKHDHNLLKDAWTLWKQGFQLHYSDQYHAQKLIVRFYKRWRLKLSGLDGLENKADHLANIREQRQVAVCWQLWRKAMELRKSEAVLAESVNLRMLSAMFVTWKRRVHENQRADLLYDCLVLKHALRSWKASKDNIRVLEHRAVKHEARQNEVLVRAVWRVWKAHERGRLLERVRGTRLLKQAWAVWQQHLRNLRQREASAVAFSMRSSSALATTALRRWHQVYTTHQNAQAFAAHYHSSHLRYKILLTWRLQLRVKLKQVKAAKTTEKMFITRSAWQKWLEKMKQSKIEKKLKDFEQRRAARYFKEWLQRTQVKRQRKLAEDIIRQRVNLRTMTETLNHWTNRVADNKFREFDTSARYQNTLTAAAFKKWKALCIRHVEELSLMESYQDVKREENMRRMFYRWLNAARKVRHRRLLLQQKEEELKFAVVAGAWDRWRERYLSIRLQPTADVFLVQSQQNLMFRAFGIWHMKTKTLPAVRFHANHLKARHWKIWRDAMPRALQAKEAREMDRKAVLVKAYAKWVQAHKTKLELKAPRPLFTSSYCGPEAYWSCTKTSAFIEARII
ncbi:hypothetical protein PHLGIDRAFT_116291 [Phlebiopsis gigantea 11061_1 CR5-6]|uniref:Sfi1 spindle body domain-containing protein n=1 Tax=Phlebiopsis gigantea (strain 11061_1 CR5-6) TaxID=745531 RepID=A0A0C3S2H3_PHLG1|nr:hypothetical protein PHLGIDRAFT_116291 [Phlebiopsis gigantea 11061_1 CR5-6]